MSLPKFSVANAVLVNMLMIVILVGGALFATSIVREFFPEARPDKLSVTAIYPGVQPAEIEKAVTIKIENATRYVEGVEKVASTVSEGLSTTTLTLQNDVDDVDAVLQEVNIELNGIVDMPDDVEQITIRKMEPLLPCISVAIYGEVDEASLKRAARNLRDDLLLLPGISDVEINGTRDDEISVEILPHRLLKFDITFDEVAAAIRESNLDVSGGQLKGERASVSVRTLGEETRGIDLEDIVVRSELDGRKIHLSDVAIVRDDFVDTDVESYFNGEPGVYCVVYKRGTQDAIHISETVKAFVRGKLGEPFDPYGFDAAFETSWYYKPIALALASGKWVTQKLSGRADLMKVYDESRATPFDHNYKVALHTDLSRFIADRLDLMMRNGATGLILVLISLNLFLNWRVAFWAAVGLPVSFLGTFCVMWFFGLSFNMVSMFGLIIVLGIIVDDAIIVGENIYRHVEEGMPPIKAAIVGAEEVMWPVVVAILTTVAAFSPLLFVQGQMGDFMGQLPIVVLAALSVSLMEALLILPSHLAHLPPKKLRSRGRPAPPAAGFIRRTGRGLAHFQSHIMQSVVLSYYERFLRLTLRWRYVTLSIACATLMVTAGMWQGGIVERMFIQDMDSETLIAVLEMPVGTPIDQVRDRLQRLSKAAVEMPEIENVQMLVGLQFSFSGNGAFQGAVASHVGQLVIELTQGSERESKQQRNSEELLVELRRISDTLAGVNSITWEAMNGAPGGKDVEVKVTGKDFDELLAVAEDLKSALAGYEGVYDIDDDFEEGKREVQLRLRKSARPTGITVGMLGGEVRSAMYGQEARTITRNREDVRIMVRYPESFRRNVYNLESMWIPTLATATSSRGWVPLGEVAELTEADSYSSIHRNEQERSVTVSADVDKALTEPNAILERIRESFVPQQQKDHPQVRVDFLGSYEEQQKTLTSLSQAFPIALLMIYMLLAGLFRSYLQPVVVMAAIPFGIQGAVVGHWLTGNPLTIMSAIGMVALTGIVVNDSLVLVDFINTRVRAGMSHFEASVEGSKLRLRAILLTTLTTAAGLTPMMFEKSFQAVILIPMAVTLTFGLIFATVLTLVIVPTMNMIFFDVSHFASRMFRELFGRRATGDLRESLSQELLEQPS